MDHRRQGQPHCAQTPRAPLTGESKKNATPLLAAIESLLTKAEPPSRHRQAARLTEHLFAHLVCLGSHTVTGLLSTCGRQFEDWSAHYRMYGRNRIAPESLFAAVRRELCARQSGPVVTALDDTRVRKSGRNTHGVSYTRDPMGPPFHVNFIRAQRFVQISMAARDAQGQARMIPVDWCHAPMPRKPGRNASQAQWADYRLQRARARISAVGAERIRRMRQWLDDNGAAARTLWTLVDGTFTNGTVLKNLPDNTVLVGRVRADAKLYYLPEEQPPAQGRRRVYGNRAPTPEQLRQDETHPWKQIEVFFGGALRHLRVKQLRPVRWRAAGGNHTLQLVVIAPTPYRVTTRGKLLYHRPAYLICTDPQAALQDIIQYYLWRWDIEVNFRDEKTVLGLGEAQVRTPHAVDNVTGVAVAAYALLLTAAATCRHHNTPHNHLPAPKWRRKKPPRATTINLIQHLRYELWARSIHFSSFIIDQQCNTKPKKTAFPLQSALFYASRYS